MKKVNLKLVAAIFLIAFTMSACNSEMKNDAKKVANLSYEITHFRVSSDNLNKNVVEQLKVKNAEMNEIRDKYCKEWESETCTKFRKMCDVEYDKIDKK